MLDLIEDTPKVIQLVFLNWTKNDIFMGWLSYGYFSTKLKSLSDVDRNSEITASLSGAQVLGVVSLE